MKEEIEGRRNDWKEIRDKGMEDDKREGRREKKRNGQEGEEKKKQEAKETGIARRIMSDSEERRIDE